MEKRGRGRPAHKSKVPASKLPSIALMAETVDEIMEQTGIGERGATLLAKITKLSIEEFHDKQRDQLQQFLVELADDLRREKDNLSTYQKGIVYGIIHDKLVNQPKGVAQSIHFHLKGGDACGALKALLGPQGDSILSAPSPRSSKAPNYLEPVDVTATDATPPRASDSKSPASST